MPASVTKPARVVPLDGDRLGTIGGAFAALLVALIQMFLRDAGPLTTTLRAGWAYVGVYAATFILVRVFLRASLRQMITERQTRRDERRRQMLEARETAGSGTARASGGAAGPGSLAGQTGLPPL